jgi:hypothetical protein
MHFISPLSKAFMLFDPYLDGEVQSMQAYSLGFFNYDRTYEVGVEICSCSEIHCVQYLFTFMF